MTKKIAIYNSKGGVGKTTISVTLSHILAKSGYRVLLIDLDAQRNAAMNFGVDKEVIRKTFYHLIRLDKDELSEIDKTKYVYRVRTEEDGFLDVMPNENYSKINKIASEEAHVFDFLDKYLKPFEEDYDVIMFDCAPTESHIVDAVLCYVKNLVIPLTPEYLSIAGVTLIYERLEYLRLDKNIVKAVIPNMMNSTNIAKDNLRFLTEQFGDIITTPIPKRVAFTEVSQFNATIWEYQMDSSLRSILNSIVQKVVSNIE